MLWSITSLVNVDMIKINNNFLRLHITGEAPTNTSKSTKSSILELEGAVYHMRTFLVRLILVLPNRTFLTPNTNLTEEQTRYGFYANFNGGKVT